MTELLTAAQMRAIEQAAIESGDATGLELMERAGRGVVEAVFEEWPEYAKAPQSVAVLCGPGNNGGDGFVLARLLAGKGWAVKVFLCDDPEKLPPDARINYEIWVADNPVEELTEKALRELPHALYVDALFGTGLTRPLEGAARDVITHLGGRNGDNFRDRLVCIDAPSGLCMDSGRVVGNMGWAFGPKSIGFARLTVAFDCAKQGHFLSDGPKLCGKLIVKDIGLCGRNRRLSTNRLFSRASSLVSEIEPFDVSRLICPEFLDVWGKREGNHKYSHGHAFILSGGAGKTGAARLAARGALRIGAGLVTLGVPPSAQMEVASQITSLMLTRVEGAGGLATVLEDERINALCLGPGLGPDRAKDLVPVALASGRKVVLDADALSAYADAPETLFDMLHKDCLLTPHGGEFARLFPDIAEKLNAVPTKGPAYSKVDATHEAAKRVGCVVLFKGPDTVIADPDGRCSINSAQYDRAAPWLATAGSGDVLAGFITGLLARGFAPMQAAETAAWLHVECALSFGPGLIAEDLPEELPKVFRSLDL